VCPHPRAETSGQAHTPGRHLHRTRAPLPRVRRGLGPYRPNAL